MERVSLVFFAAIATVLCAALLAMRRDVRAESAGRFFLIAKIAAGLAVFFLLARGIILSVLQYETWQRSGGASAMLLPPHQPISYFLGYAWTHFGKAAAFSFIFAGILFFLMRLGNRLSGNRFFYREEPYLAAFGVLAAPWPAGMLVMGIVLAVGLLMQAVLAAAGRRGRLPLLHFWLPAALGAILFGDIIVRWLGLTQFRV